MHALILLLIGESDHLNYLMLFSCFGFAVLANRMLCYQVQSCRRMWQQSWLFLQPGYGSNQKITNDYLRPNSCAITRGSNDCKQKCCSIVLSCLSNEMQRAIKTDKMLYYFDLSCTLNGFTDYTATCETQKNTIQSTAELWCYGGRHTEGMTQNS